MRTTDQKIRDIWTIINPASVTAEMWDQEPVETGPFAHEKRLMTAQEDRGFVLWDHRWGRRFGPFQDMGAILAWLAKWNVGLDAPITATMPWDKVS